VDIVYTKKLFSFSFKSLKYLKQMDFSAPIELRVKDFYAKRDKTIFPKRVVKFGYKVLAIYIDPSALSFILENNIFQLRFL